MMSATFATAGHGASSINVVCTKYEVSNDIWSTETVRDKLICNNYAGSLIYAYDSAYTSATAFKEAVKGQLLAYVKA